MSKLRKDNIIIVIPALNPPENFCDYIEILREDFPNIVVVNDGSSEYTGPVSRFSTK